MAKIAYLGPVHTFSHELVRQEFPGDEHVPCNTLHEVVEAVGAGNVEAGVVPFYNTTRKSIEESQIELVTHKTKVFVTDVLPLEVRHFLCGFGQLSEISEIRSKSVVFHQTSAWAQKYLPKAREVGYESTSLAVQSVAKDRTRHIAAIGTNSAAKHNNVPIIKKNIQNKPNFTLFFVIRRRMAKIESLDHFLLCAPNATDREKDEISKEVSQAGCSVSANWTLQLEKKKAGVRSAYFFEVDGQYSTLGLYSSVKSVGNRIRKTFVVGGYREKCITRLLWAQDN
jgi:prephenate dehydratase